jgi:hypothetical protein
MSGSNDNLLDLPRVTLIVGELLAYCTGWMLGPGFEDIVEQGGVKPLPFHWRGGVICIQCGAHVTLGQGHFVRKKTMQGGSRINESDSIPQTVPTRLDRSDYIGIGLLRSRSASSMVPF